MNPAYDGKTDAGPVVVSGIFGRGRGCAPIAAAAIVGKLEGSWAKGGDIEATPGIEGC